MSTNYCGSYEHVQTARLLCLLYVSERTISRTYAAKPDCGSFRDRKVERQILCHKAGTIISTD